MVFPGSESIQFDMEKLFLLTVSKKTLIWDETYRTTHFAKLEKSKFSDSCFLVYPAVHILILVLVHILILVLVLILVPLGRERQQKYQTHLTQCHPGLACCLGFAVDFLYFFEASWAPFGPWASCLVLGSPLGLLLGHFWMHFGPLGSHGWVLHSCLHVQNTLFYGYC